MAVIREGSQQQELALTPELGHELEAALGFFRDAHIETVYGQRVIDGAQACFSLRLAESETVTTTVYHPVGVLSESSVCDEGQANLRRLWVLVNRLRRPDYGRMQRPN